MFNSFSSQARGVAIFLRKDNPAKIVDKFCDENGNLLAIGIIYEEKKNTFGMYIWAKSRFS